MNSTTVAVIGGALLIATAVGAVVWYTRKTAAGPVGVVAPAPGSVTTPATVTYITTPETAQRPASAVLAPVAAKAVVSAPSSGGGGGLSSVVSGISNAATTIGNIVNTGKSIIDTVGNLFNNFKLF